MHKSSHQRRSVQKTWGYGATMQRMMQKSVEKGGTCIKHGAMMKQEEEVSGALASELHRYQELSSSTKRA
eukprot:scaffold12816_cov126-Skeletonema_dohrnii-CCMP3373.AAC.2